MKLSRLVTGTATSACIFVVWLAACSNSATEACGLDRSVDGLPGLQSGTCEQAMTCPSGTYEIVIADPADMCPSTYVCCGPVVDGGHPAATPGYGSASADGG